MELSNKKIDHLLRVEVATKGITAAVTFAIFSIIIFYYHFNVSQFLIFVRIACVMVFLISMVRIYYCRLLAKDPSDDPSWRIVRLCIWTNSVAWGVIFCLSSLELKSFGIDYSVLLLIMAGFVSSSLGTLSYDKGLFFPFQFAILGSMTAVAFYNGAVTGQREQYILALCLFVCLAYQFSQFKSFRDALIRRFTYQVELEGSYSAVKESQDALISQTVKLIHASKVSALGDMAGGLSHEVNNSLMVILGSIQQLERNIRSDHGKNPTYENKIVMARNAINKIKSVIDGLRFFSQQMEPAPKENVPLEEIIQRTLNFCFEIIKAHSIRLDIDRIPNVEIHCQPIQITQVVFNLLKNAFDALEKTPKAEEKWIRVSFIQRLDELNISVSNGGPKISEASAAKLFQPFFTTKDVGKGTGLSLSISKGIARDHLGDLNLDEEKEHTTFVLNLPLKHSHS